MAQSCESKASSHMCAVGLALANFVHPTMAAADNCILLSLFAAIIYIIFYKTNCSHFSENRSKSWKHS